MTNEQAALYALMFVLLGFLVVGALASPTLLLPKTPKARRRGPKPPKLKHEAAIAKALAFLEPGPSDIGEIIHTCRECGRRRFQPSKTAIETTVNGLVCVAVCRSCGAALVSRILKPAEAAAYVDAGSARVWPRLVVARTELAGVHNATQFSDAVIEARRTTP